MQALFYQGKSTGPYLHPDLGQVALAVAVRKSDPIICIAVGTLLAAVPSRHLLCEQKADR